MSGLTVRQAKRSEAKPLIGLYAESGTGKTLSALFLARGFVGPQGRIGMIESESGRGEAHSDTRVGDSYVGGFEVISLRDGFSPKTYGEAITLAEQSRWDALIIDSASHEWEGIEGVLHWAAENQAKGAKGPLVWQKPKIDHQRHFVGRLLQTPIKLVIVCMRAKYPMEEAVKDGKKEWVRSQELSPKQSEDILYEMFVHGWIDRDHRFQGTKYTRTELASVLESGKPITNATGAALARWAAGEQATPTADLASVVASFKAAQSIKDLQAVGGAAKGLPDADKGAATVAYKERLDELKAAAAPQAAPPPEKEPGTEG